MLFHARIAVAGGWFPASASTVARQVACTVRSFRAAQAAHQQLPQGAWHG